MRLCGHPPPPEATAARLSATLAVCLLLIEPGVGGSHSTYCVWFRFAQPVLGDALNGWIAEKLPTAHCALFLVSRLGRPGQLESTRSPWGSIGAVQARRISHPSCVTHRRTRSL